MSLTAYPNMCPNTSCHERPGRVGGGRGTNGWQRDQRQADANPCVNHSTCRVCVYGVCYVCRSPSPANQLEAGQARSLRTRRPFAHDQGPQKERRYPRQFRNGGREGGERAMRRVGREREEGEGGWSTLTDSFGGMRRPSRRRPFMRCPKFRKVSAFGLFTI